MNDAIPQIAAELEGRSFACTVTLVDTSIPSPESSPAWLTNVYGAWVALRSDDRAAYLRSASDDETVLREHEALLNEPAAVLDRTDPNARGLLVRSLGTRLAALEFSLPQVSYIHYISASAAKDAGIKAAKLRHHAVGSFRASVLVADHFSVLRAPAVARLAISIAGGIARTDGAWEAPRSSINAFD